MLKVYMNTVYENIFLVHVNMLGFIGWNNFSTESAKMLKKLWEAKKGKRKIKQILLPFAVIAYYK